ncbi:hypothetical protein M3Y97_00636000 [Aphelenchoides bicaudatus]|nr:hypothetical protein M3Y97_00636000 [Aphelenchoides bicaudatus]
MRGRDCNYAAASSGKKIKHVCKYCRFQRCVWNGLCISAVVVRPVPDEISCFNVSTVIQRLVLCNKSKFVNRFYFTIKSYQGRADSARIGIKNPTAIEVFRIIETEFSVMFRYLEQCGFIHCGVDGDALKQLATSVFDEWLCYQCIVATSNNSGHITDEFYFSDESRLSVDYKQLLEFVQPLNGLVDAAVLARAGEDYLKQALEAAEMFNQARLDNCEYVAMGQLLLLRTATQLFPDNASLRHYTNTIFEALRRHYDLNFEETAVRLGSLILLIDQVRSLNHAMSEFLIMWKLNGVEQIFHDAAQFSKHFCKLTAGSPNSNSIETASLTSVSSYEDQ